MAGPPRLIIPALGKVYDAFGRTIEPAIRIVVGLSLAAHGYPKLFGGTAGAADFFEQAGYAPGLLWAIAVGLVEFVGGLLLAVGFLTRLAALPILVFLIAAITYHWPNGFYWNIRGWEYPLILALIVFHFLMRGGGPWSLDARIGREI